MRSNIRFLIPGKPSALRRARATMIGGHVRMYDPPANAADKKRIRSLMREAMNGDDPFPAHIPLRVNVFADFQMPKSWSRTKHPWERGPKTSKPDLDNIVKMILDAGNGIMWEDDAQVSCIIAEKVVCARDEEPVTRVEVAMIGVRK